MKQGREGGVLWPEGGEGERRGTRVERRAEAGHVGRVGYNGSCEFFLRETRSYWKGGSRETRYDVPVKEMVGSWVGKTLVAAAGRVAKVGTRKPVRTAV